MTAPRLQARLQEKDWPVTDEAVMMQDRCAGDIGGYSKYGLLLRLCRSDEHGAAAPDTGDAMPA